jgi:hypothetical protein
MTEGQVATVAWLSEFNAAIGKGIDLVIEAEPNNPRFPRFDYGHILPAAHSFPLRTRGTDQSWRMTLAATLKVRQWSTCLVNLFTVPVGSVENKVAGELLHDEAAFLVEVLRDCGPERTLVVLLPASIVVSWKTECLRTWLLENHTLEWVIYLGSEVASALCLPATFVSALLVIRTGSPLIKDPKVRRSLDLAKTPMAQWQPAISAAAKKVKGPSASGDPP